MIHQLPFLPPCSGNLAFAQVYNACVPMTFRVVNDRDMVASIPQFLFMFKHVGQEIIVDKFGNYIFNPSFVEQSLRDSPTSFDDHQLAGYIKGLDMAEQSKTTHAREEEDLLAVFETYRQTKDQSTGNNTLA